MHGLLRCARNDGGDGNAYCRHPRECGDPVRRGLSVQSLASLEYWVARSCRAMTVEYVVAISRRIAPEVCLSLVAPENRGRREDRVLAAPAVSCAKCAQKNAHTSIQVQRKQSGLPCAMAL